MKVIPRHASTVVLMDQNSRVYLTKRPKTMKFLGGYYVFPGGAVEVSDYEMNHEFMLNVHRNDCYNSFYVAAARELFEEAGILLCSKKNASTVQLSEEKEYMYRRLLINRGISFLHFLKQEGLYLNFKHLNYFGKLITSEDSPIRFDTRFFLAKLPVGQTTKPDEYEIDDAIWITPEEAICAYQKGEMKMASPTVLALLSISKFQKGGPLKMLNCQKGKLLGHKDQIIIKI